ncbi:DUF7344 domain-containing protein [Natrialba asiatica]|uniref:DUF7344 domain-containing protein n=1 Tax=Natrialba asiatica (strain ATCC 700177 / DSM 12278 / JCM 9576 / FERM P-10747 / NBRC 102637 / 172P1) TaxID=29540 RepID=M0B1B8_NATA1|nr:hypothetical protein [Natrialba asiatica]ELZ04711.1 hypothetical protein C481_04176 [Natrialba asiatica DSM 12278]
MERQVPQPESAHGELTEDELFELLANRRRRHILQTLIYRDERIDIGALSQSIAASEDDLAFDEVSSSDRKRVYTALQQSHLPKMDNAGVLEFDRDRGTVKPTPALKNVEIYMDIVHGRKIPWNDYYLGLTALVTVVLAGSLLDIVPFSLLPAAAWSGLVVITLGGFALAHRYYAHRNHLRIRTSSPDVELEYDELREQ